MSEIITALVKSTLRSVRFKMDAFSGSTNEGGSYSMDFDLSEIPGPASTGPNEDPTLGCFRDIISLFHCQSMAPLGESGAQCVCLGCICIALGVGFGIIAKV